MRSILLAFSFYFFIQNAYSQCELGEVALTMSISVDAWGQETYWEIVPSGNSCGDGTVAWGSNDLVGCEGLDPDNGDDGYADNTIVTEGVICLTEGEMYDLIFVDSYGDGGLEFELYEEGLFSHLFIGAGDGNTWTFEAGNSGLPENDSPCGAIAITPNGAAIDMDNNTAAAQLTEPHPNGGGCGTPGFWCDSDENISRTIWAYFIAEANTTYEITTCNEALETFDTQLALYHVGDCGDFSTFTLVASNDDMGGCDVANGFSSRMFANCLEDGGTYYIQLDGWQDAHGIASLTVETTTAQPALNANVGNINCPLNKGEEANGSLTPYLSNAGVNFTSSWTGPNGFESEENYPNGLQPGSYSVVVTDACGVTYNGSFLITQPNSWNVIFNGMGPQCASSTDGSIDLTVTGGTAPYEFNWATQGGFSSTNEDLQNLGIGQYQLIVEDDNGCELLQNYTLNPSNSFSFELGSDTTLCQDDQLVVSGPAGLTYNWQDGSNNQFFLINAEDWNLGANSVVLTATSPVGCTFSDAFIFVVEVCENVGEEFSSVMSVWPNPSDNQLNILTDKKFDQLELNLYNLNGQLVYSKVFFQTELLQLEMDLPVGIYQLELKADGTRHSTPIAIQH
jgi:hypothetical protein